MFVRLLLFASCCATAFAQQAVTIEGRVVSASGSPIRRAVVQARNVGGGGATSAVVLSSGTVSTNPVVGAETDGEGRFSIKAMQLGSVTLNVLRSGYQTASQTVAILPGQNSVNVTIPLKRLGIIYGKVVDEYNDPFGRVNVTLYRRIYDNGWRWQQVNASSAAPDGTYWFGDLQAGRYYVGAADMTSPAPGGQTTRYVPTFYPGATEPSGATAVEIALEAEVHGIDIRMQRGRMFRVSGKISMMEGLQSAGVSLVPREMNVQGPLRPTGVANAKEGAFIIDGVPEGTYYAQVQMPLRSAGAAGGQTMVTGREPVTVSGRDVDNVMIQLTPGVEIKGRVRVDGVVSPPAATGGNRATPQPRITLRPLEQGAPGASSTQITADGEITIRNVPPGTFLISAAGAPGTYTASIRYDGDDATWTPITVGKSGGTLEVVLKTDGARVTGVARDDKGELLKGTRVTIWSSAKRGYATSAMTDQAGTFNFQNLPPGEYRVVAWDSNVSSPPVFATLFGAMEFLHQFDSAAATVRLDPSGQSTQDVKMVPGAAMEDALGRLP